MDRLTALFARVFNVAPDTLGDESTPDTVPQWDSLKAMELVSEIEEAFGVELTTGEIMIMDSIGRAREVLRRKGATDI